LLSFKALLGSGFDPGLRRRQRTQPIFPALELFRQAYAVGNRRLIRLFSQGEQLLHLGLALGFDLLDGPVGKRAVPRGVGVNLVG
jgi:hypothetical protein